MPQHPPLPAPMPESRAARLAAVLALVLSLALLALMMPAAVTRPLWIDEQMAMVSYPLGSLGAMFDPLPYYSQAAPPLFNLISTLLGDLHPDLIRLVLMLLCTLGLLAAALAVFPSLWAAATVFFVLAALRPVFVYWTELKYYGLESTGFALVIAWFLVRSRTRPFGWRDAAILFGATCLGISVMVIAALAMLAVLAERLLGGMRPGWREILPAGALLVGIAAYYLAIGHATGLQMATYTDVYDRSGIDALRLLIRSAGSVAGPYFIPLLGLGFLATLVDRREPRSRRLLVLAVLTAAAFAVLAMMGRYPAYATRHVAWASAFYLFFVLGGVRVLLAWLAARRPGAPALVPLAVTGVVLAAMALALVPSARFLRNPQGFIRDYTDAEALAGWLRQADPQAVGLWFGGQPVVDYYRKIYPELDRHSYFGRVDATSAAVPPEMLSPAFLAQDMEAIGQVIEPLRQEPGAWARMVVYRQRLDHSVPAQTLFDEAPKDRPFYILVSHATFSPDIPATRPRTDMVSRNGALMREIARRGCGYEVELSVRGGYILKVDCSG